MFLSQNTLAKRKHVINIIKALDLLAETSVFCDIFSVENAIYCLRNAICQGRDMPFGRCYAHDIEPGFGDDMIARFKKYAAFSRPSSTLIRLSSCSIDITLS